MVLCRISVGGDGSASPQDIDGYTVYLEMKNDDNLTYQ